MANVELNVNLNPVLDETKLNNIKVKIKDALKTDEVKVNASLDDNSVKSSLNKLKSEKIDIDVEINGETIGKEAEKIPDVINDKLKKGLGSIDIAKVFNAQVLSGAINELGNQFNALTQPFIAYEKQLADLSAITGISGAALDDFGDRARQLALKFGGDATQQIEAFKGVLSRLGPDIAKSPEALNMMAEAINTVSKASGLDATQSMDALTTSMLQFGVDLNDPIKAAGEMQKMMNVLAAGAKEGAAEIPQVSDAVKVAGVAAYGAKISFEETNAAIQALATGGKVGAEAGTALRNVLGKLQDQSGEGSKQLAVMGLTVKQLGETLTTKGLAETLELLGTGFEKLGTDAEKNAALMQLFGTENAAAAGILLRNAGAIETLTDKLTGTNTAYDQAAVNMDTIAAKSERFKAQMTDMAISFGKAIGSVGIGAAGALVETSKVLTSALQIKSIIPPELISSTKDAMNTLGTTVINGIGKINQTLGASSQTALASSFSFKALWAAITGPIGLVITAITAVGAGLYLLYQNSEEFRNAVDGLFTGIKNAVSGIWDGLVSGFQAAWTLLKTAFDAVYPYIAGTIGVAFIALKLALTAIWEVMKFIGGYINDVFVVTWNAVASVVNAVSNRISELWKWFTSLFQSTEKSNEGFSIFKTILFALSPILVGAIELIRRAGEGFKRAGDMATFTNAVLAGLSGSFEAFKVAITDMWDALLSFDIGKLKDSLSGLGGKIVEGFNKGFDKTIAEKQAKDATEAAKNVVEQANKESEAKAAKTEEAKKATVNKAEKAKQTDILETFKKQQELSNEVLKNAKIETDLANAQAGRKKTKEQEIEQEARKNVELQKQRNILEQIIEKQKGTIVGGKIEFTGKVKDDTKDKLQKELTDINNALAESEISILNLDAQINSDDLKEQYEFAKAKLTGEKLVIDAEIKAGKAFDYQSSKLDVELIKNDLRKANIELLEAQKQGDKTLILEKQNSIVSINQKLFESEKKYNSDLNKYKISLIEDANKQELELKKLAIQETYDKEVIAAQNNAQLIIEANNKKNAALLKANQDYWDATATLSEKATQNLANSFIEAFQGLEIAFPKVDTTSITEDAENSQKELAKKMKENTLSYADYSKQYNEIDAKRNEALKDSNKDWTAIQDAANKSMIKGFESFAKKYEKDNEQLLKDVQENKISYQDFEKKYYETAVILQGTAFAQMLLDGENFFSSMAIAALGFLKSMVPIWGAQLFGGAAATPQSVLTGGGWALAQYAAFNIAMQGLIAIAEGALKRETGGLVPGGEQLVRMNEKGQEFVMNHIATGINLKHFQKMNDLNISVEEYANRYLPANTQTVNFDLFIQSHKELRQDIGVMNNTIKRLGNSFAHKTSLDVQVNTDINKLHNLQIKQAKRNLVKW